VGWRVRVHCPGCGNVVEVVMRGFQLVHNCEPTKYKPGEIVEILPPDPKVLSDIDYALRLQIHRKKRMGGYGLPSFRNFLCGGHVCSNADHTRDAACRWRSSGCSFK
jgi:hypothetical protein